MEGSQKIELEVTYSEVLGRVQSASYYIGESAKESLGEVAALLQASSDDDTVMKDNIKEAATKVANVLQRFVGTTSVASAVDSSAPAYRSTSVYGVGDVVTHDDKFYTCVTAVTIPEAWDEAKWSEISEYSADATYAEDDLVKKDGLVYRCTTAIATAEAWDGSHWEALSYPHLLFTTLSPANFNVEEPGVYPAALSAAVYDYMTDYVMREWTKPIAATSQYYAAKVTEDTTAIRELSSHRKKPSR